MAYKGFRVCNSGKWAKRPFCRASNSVRDQKTDPTERRQNGAEMMTKNTQKTDPVEEALRQGKPWADLDQDAQGAIWHLRVRHACRTAMQSVVLTDQGRTLKAVLKYTGTEFDDFVSEVLNSLGPDDPDSANGKHDGNVLTSDPETHKNAHSYIWGRIIIVARRLSSTENSGGSVLADLGYALEQTLAQGETHKRLRAKDRRQGVGTSFDSHLLTNKAQEDARRARKGTGSHRYSVDGLEYWDDETGDFVRSSPTQAAMRWAVYNYSAVTFQDDFAISLHVATLTEIEDRAAEVRRISERERPYRDEVAAMEKVLGDPPEHPDWWPEFEVKDSDLIQSTLVRKRLVCFRAKGTDAGSRRHWDAMRFAHEHQLKSPQEAWRLWGHCPECLDHKMPIKECVICGDDFRASRTNQSKCGKTKCRNSRVSL